jgi:tetratricopeptide (TPR) repeat protein
MLMKDYARLGRRLCFALGLALVSSAPNVLHAEEAVHFVNGHWYDGSGFQDRDLFSLDGRLKEQWDGEVRTVDLEGGWIVPGFGNAHTHGIGNEDYEIESARFLANGVYYVANPNSIASRSRLFREAALAERTVDARFANGGLTCSGGHPIQLFESTADSRRMAGDAYFAIDDLKMLENQWGEILETGPDFLKVYLERSEHHASRKDDSDYYGKRGLDPRLVPEVVTRAHAAGLRVSAHVTSAHDFHIAVEAGVDEIAHLPLEPIAEADAQLAASRGVILVTTALSHRPSDAVDDLDALHLSNLRLLRTAGVALVLGTDSQATVVDEVLKLSAIGAMGPAELLRLLVHDTPQWIFPDRRIGAFHEGAEASFVVLDSNPLEDLAALRHIRDRYKSGQRLEISEARTEELPGVGQQLVHTLMARGADAAIAEYHRLRTEESDDWDFSEGQLDALGRALIQHGKTAEAVAIFRLNCEQFPHSSNAWDSLGDSYAGIGELRKARESYSRALELDPQNDGYRRKLDQLGQE